MKRYIITLIVALIMGSYGWASDFATLGDFLTTYVEHFEESIPDSYEYIDVYFTNISTEDELYPILQKALYLDMIDNLRKPLNHNLLITETSLAQVMQAHRGQTREKSNKHVTQTQLQRFVDALPDYRAYFCGLDTQTYTIDVSDFALTQAENFAIMDDVYQKLTTSYLYHDQVRERDLIAGAIRGMAESAGDEYTTYFLPAESESFQQSLGSEYSGVGVVVEAADDGLVVVSPFRGSPAQQAGLQPEDIITHVDGTSIAGMGAGATNLILGPEGTTVDLSVQRGDEIHTITVTRRYVKIQMVSDELLSADDYYISLSSFGYGSALELQEGIGRALESGAQTLILDLRHNPGGSVRELESMLDVFLEPGSAGFTMRGEGYDYTYNTGPSTVSYADDEVIILVDEGTASAAEMLGLILQDHGRAQLVGEQTFGKGTAQSMTDYPDGSSFKFTVYEWFSLLSDTSINGVGVQPDIVIPLDQDGVKKGRDNQLEYAQNL